MLLKYGRTITFDYEQIFSSADHFGQQFGEQIMGRDANQNGTNAIQYDFNHVTKVETKKNEGN
jgi:hypothetical protein